MKPHWKPHCHLFFETLGNRLKMDILLALEENQLSVNELALGVNQERSKVSHALKSLRGCCFVSSTKRGRQRVYTLNKKTIIPLMNLVDKHMRSYCKVCKRAG